ncbi:probable arginine--tRNA ligase, mitochondrial [Thrips palmi]|uniref:Probable arginine--tRNA ligase, mitochondrial n=1 Tax=Thrips palmi TaxID=161013 RepID=A0A6P8YPS1_THRPL|nr:probable arginine--tRNA ligase, mitochondrial [Thrips palmi]
MASTLKHHVSRRLLELFVQGRPSTSDVVKLASKVNLRKSADFKIGLSVPTDSLSACSNNFNLENVQNSLKADNIVNSVSVIKHQGKTDIFFHLHHENFVREILENNAAKKPLPSRGKRVIVEFSSPNIAKPIHMGHLRSTIIGNFIANLHEWFGYEVLRFNYLGDWGTQFGLVKVGMKILNPSQEELSQKPLSTLYQAYITANAAAEKDPALLDDARKIFMNLECGKQDDISDWKLYKEYTIAELMKTYSRLGIVFDKYSWESDYKADSIVHILKLLDSSGLMATDKEGRSIVNVAGKEVPVLKSDGSTLYLTRDIAAAIDRQEKYRFDMMYYLADTSQHRHFINLFHILKDLNLPWSENLKHIRFGRVRGMSTRQGQVVFLNDILNEAHQLMIKQQKESPNTKVDLLEDLTTADILGVSAIVAADLIHKRQKDYTFNWESARSITGNTGVRLQYTHCRLKSLHENSPLASAHICEPLLLSETAAVNLVFEISRFEEVLERSFDELEASKLSEYLFTLCDAINKAMIALHVSNAGKVGEQRLRLFEEARIVLHRGMTLLGLSPLNRM